MILAPLCKLKLHSTTCSIERRVYQLCGRVVCFYGRAVYLVQNLHGDNLNNGFIAGRIVTQVKSAKFTRQFIFATHNANIPVFGDAEWVGVLEASADNATLVNSNQ